MSNESGFVENGSIQHFHFSVAISLPTAFLYLLFCWWTFLVKLKYEFLASLKAAIRCLSNGVLF